MFETNENNRKTNSATIEKSSHTIELHENEIALET